MFPPTCAISTGLFCASDHNFGDRGADKKIEEGGRGTKNDLLADFMEFCSSKSRLSLPTSESLAITIYFLANYRSMGRMILFAMSFSSLQILLVISAFSALKEIAFSSNLAKNFFNLLIWDGRSFRSVHRSLSATVQPFGRD